MRGFERTFMRARLSATGLRVMVEKLLVAADCVLRGDSSG